MAKQQLRDSVIRAPFSGIVVKKFSNEAEIVSSVMPSRPILWLMKIDRVKVEVEIPDVKIMVVRKGTPVDVKIDALPGKLFEGNVSRVNAMVDPISRNFKVEIDIPNSKHIVKPGMFARITVKTDVVKDTIIVPQKALVVDDAGNDAVFVLNDNEAVIKRVTVGVSNANMVEIRDGLKDGEKVIVTGNYGLEEGTKVSPTVVTY
jgi:RND family efflux transporter MFP subunit